jgi:hypothetical protein
MTLQKVNGLRVLHPDKLTLEQYVALRRNGSQIPAPSAVPDTDFVYRSVAEIKEDLIRFDISPEVLVEAMLGNSDAISELSLSLMERLIARDAMPEAIDGYRARRGDAISDVLINRIAVRMLEGAIDGNPDLDVLVKHQLAAAGTKPKKKRDSRPSLDDIRVAASKCFNANRKPAVRSMADILGVSATTLLRSVQKSDLQRIRAAYDPTNEAGRSAIAIIRRYMGPDTLIDFRVFLLAFDIIHAHPSLPAPNLLSKVEFALRGSGVSIPRTALSQA